jgi:hypothetical protein
MEAEFRRSPSSISRLVNDFIAHIMSRWDYVLTWDTCRLTWAKLGEYADLCYERSSRECDSIFGVIDGTVRKIQAPSIGQQAAFNGHKHTHALKYQAVVVPDGIIIHISRAYVGSPHDYTIYKDSGLIDILTGHAYGTEGCPIRRFYLPTRLAHDHWIYHPPDSRRTKVQ